MRNVLAVSLLFSSQILSAQSLGGVPRQPQAIQNELDRRVQLQAFEKWALDPDIPKNELASKQAAAAQEFYAKAKHFVELWQVFALELNDKQTFNAKLAKEVSKAFHDMEKSDGWPIGRSK